MKLRIYLLAFAVLPLAAHMAAQDNEQERERVEQGERLDFRRESRPEGQRYSFEDYIDDLTAVARNDPPPENPVSRMDSKRPDEYKPLNPMTIFQW